MALKLKWKEGMKEALEILDSKSGTSSSNQRSGFQTSNEKYDLKSTLIFCSFSFNNK